MSENNEFVLFWPEVPEIFKPLSYEHLSQAKCSFCNEALTEKMYLLEKSFHRDMHTKEISQQFEIFICRDCFTEINNAISEESKARMEQFQAQKMDTPYRRKLFESNYMNINRWLKYCAVTNKRIDLEEEFNIAGIFLGDTMLYDGLPMAISMEGLLQMDEVYSNKTRDVLDDFFSKLPPDILQKIKNSPLVLI
jgi:hypothetical protein